MGGILSPWGVKWGKNPPHRVWRRRVSNSNPSLSPSPESSSRRGERVATHAHHLSSPPSTLSLRSIVLAGRPCAMASSLEQAPMTSTDGDERRFTSSPGSGSSNQSQAQHESVNDSEPIQIEDDDVIEEDTDFGTKRKLTSAVWKEFKKLKVLGEVKAQCTHCHKKLSGKSSSGTKHLHDHLAICTLRKIKLAGKNKTLAQSALRFSSKEGGKVSVENYTFDPEVARKELATMITLHEYPLSIVDHVGFRRFVSALQPLFKMMTRNTIRKDIMDAYLEERKKAQEYMAATKSKVAITTDMWTSDNQKRGYMAVTAHFIDDSWMLRNIIMRFIYVPAPHTAEIICDVLYDALVEWNLDEKVSTITLDNCTTNDKVITDLIKKLGKEKLMLEGKLLHMRCAAHILNLIVKDGLEVIQPAISKIRDSVAFWTATPKRVEKFAEIAKYVKVPIENKLGLDCKTRWNSTYKMLSVALNYVAVFNRASRVDKLYDCAPSMDDWAFAREVVQRLKMFNDITAVFSGTNYVTANVQLLKICEAKVQMRQWSVCGNPIIEQMSANMIEKFDKYWIEIQGIMGIATILDPRFKTDYLLGFIESITGEDSEVCAEQVREITDSLCDLMKGYELEEDGDNTESSAPPLASSDVLSSISARVATRRPTMANLKSELDRYLEDELVSIATENFQILDWWKVIGGTRYRTLRKIARDLFAVPVSTVASESAFSTSGRVLSDHRSRLTPDILEALMCSQNWLRNKYQDDNEDNDASFWSCLQEIQDGMEGLALF
ncbi:Unknown protein [Striga hermonthica]|uniref:BED-type domain-containing protein n=1 Tax=Striga hermonthica TaxID=68872 RepID=A0A9N7R3A8_STRHE|nr:Unknown protein [Striga hermonthica]